MTMRMSIPIEERRAPRTAAQAVQGWFRLFLIETKRSPALWGGLMVAAFTTWLMWNSLPVGVVRWREVSQSASNAMVPAAAIAAGMAVFVAGRDRRVHLDDQLIQTVAGPQHRDLLAFLSTLAWIAAGYLVAVFGFFAYAATKATWGGPSWSFVSLTLATIALGMAAGWLVGTLFPNRLSPIVAICGMLAPLGAYSIGFQTELTLAPDGSVTSVTHGGQYWNLLPSQMLNAFDIHSFMGLGILWMLALASVLAALAWWWQYRSGLTLAGLALGLVVAALAGIGLVQQSPVPWTARAANAYVEPVCESRLDHRIEVCLHPEDNALLNDTADALAILLVPVAGMPGVPIRYENQPTHDVRSDPNRATITVHDERDIPVQLDQSVIQSLFLPRSADEMSHRNGAARYVLTTWLLQQAGVDLSQANQDAYRVIYGYEEAIRTGVTEPHEVDDLLERAFDASPDELAAFEDNVNATIDRFSALSPDQQRAWLEANWDALRSGELTLEDLP